MNIQIFGTKKSSDTRKAERFFKERGIKFQPIVRNGRQVTVGLDEIGRRRKELAGRFHLRPVRGGEGAILNG